jgi:hypothetical protein
MDTKYQVARNKEKGSFYLPHPLAPSPNRENGECLVNMFEEGGKYERKLRPLSLRTPLLSMRVSCGERY